jgi:RND family efflux transporter MFP subunit
MPLTTFRTWKRNGVACSCLTLLVLIAWAAWRPTTASSLQAQSKQQAPAVLEVTGRTQCVLTRKAIIAPVPLHPVVEVRVQPGDRVKKDQVLVRLDDDEPKADVRNKEAHLENARVALKEARRYYQQCEKAYPTGALPDKRYYDARTAAHRAEMDERSALAALESAKAELEHYEVTAMIDGVVNSLEVHPGTVSRPGTAVWGEILDLRELDVRCELTPEQADRVTVGQTTEVRQNGKNELFGVGKVIFVGLSADKRTGLVPVLLRLPNPQERLRCEVPVQVRFKEPLPASKSAS